VWFACVSFVFCGVMCVFCACFLCFMGFCVCFHVCNTISCVLCVCVYVFYVYRARVMAKSTGTSLCVCGLRVCLLFFMV